MAPLKRKLTNKTAVEKYKALKDLENEISLDGQLQKLFWYFVNCSWNVISYVKI